MAITTLHLATLILILSAGLVLVTFAWWRSRRQLHRFHAALQDHRSGHRAQLHRLELELEQARRARSTFLAAANHDLRQPLQALFCFSALLSGCVRGRGRMIADQMQQSLQILNTHLESLVELSRLDAGIVEPAPMALCLGEVLDDVAARHRAAAERKGLRLHLAVAEGVAGRSDPLLLRRVLNILVDNAIRFTPQGGVLVGVRRRGARLRVEVWDSGVGMTDEQMTHIFEEFYQVGNPQRDRNNGLGLGLAVADRLVRLLPGHALQVRSRLGRGSVFALELPAAETPARPAARPAGWTRPLPGPLALRAGRA